LNYLDTSVVIPLYLPETGSARAEAAVRALARPSVSDLTEVEIASALARRRRLGELTSAEAQRILSTFEAHLAQGVYQRIELGPTHLRAAGALVWTASVNVLALDAIHVAIAQTEQLRLVTADQKMAAAAQNAGVQLLAL
jgi:predicted nucleic acid-binding protein